MSTGSSARGARPPLGIVLLPVLQAVCGVILVFDVGGEFHAVMIREERPSTLMIVHIVTEMIATLLLGLAFYLSFQQLSDQRRKLREAEERMTELRGEFGAMVQRRFDEWELSPAETDIALLSIKGLRISEIAEMRNSREGTVKAHLSAIFRKAGVRSRTDLLASFVDDFLDLAVTGAAGPAGAVNS